MRLEHPIILIFQSFMNYVILLAYMFLMRQMLRLMELLNISGITARRLGKNLQIEKRMLNLYLIEKYLYLKEIRIEHVS